jgi:hypothetical protein
VAERGEAGGRDGADLAEADYRDRRARLDQAEGMKGGGLEVLNHRTAPGFFAFE